MDPAVQLTSNGSSKSVSPNLAGSCRPPPTLVAASRRAGVTAEWIAEAAEVADASPTLGSPSHPGYKADAFVPFSFEVQGDAVNFMQELGKLLHDGAEQLSATAYTTGSGSGQPKGIITSLVASAGTVPLIHPRTAETLSAADLFTLQNALPPRFQPNAQWTANLSIINTLRQFETTNGALKFPALQGNPPTLLGRTDARDFQYGWRDQRSSDRSELPVLLYGDVRRQFVIVDRLAARSSWCPTCSAPTGGRPGSAARCLWFRTGTTWLCRNAFRLLSIPTTA